MKASATRTGERLTRAEVAHAAFAAAVLLVIAGLIVWFFSVVD